MKRTIKLTGHDQRNYAFDSIEKAMAEGKLHRVIIEPEPIRKHWARHGVKQSDLKYGGVR